MAPPILTARNLGKRYVLQHRSDGGHDLRETIALGITGLRRRLRGGGHSPGRGTEEFWALRDVSLDLAEGEVVGIIGRNGAGKSTLLKLISRITEPTTGEIRIRGRVGSLLEVGTGFHPDLTGRENIYLNGAILGMSRAEIRSKFDRIVEFSEIERFLDTPVKRYSSGMYVRLAFSVAAYLEPEILIVDEVLAVGDAAFQKKSLARMGEVAAEGRTILFVSHNLGLVRALCQRGVLIEGGRIRFDGKAEDAARVYLDSLEAAATGTVLPDGPRRGQGVVRLQRVEVSAPEGGPRGLEAGRAARFVFYTTRTLPGLSCVFDIFDSLGQHVTCFDSANSSPDDRIDGSGESRFVCELGELLLVPGRYRVDVALNRDRELQEHVEGAAVIDVQDGTSRLRPVLRRPAMAAYSCITAGRVPAQTVPQNRARRALAPEVDRGATATELVSVVIPCYNQSAYLGEAIDSVLTQTCRDREIIVVDDGSTDATPEVALRYPGVRLLRQRNAGLSAARNAGLGASRGAYVVFLDADDRLLPEALQTGLDWLRPNPATAFVSGHFRYIRADGSTQREFEQKPLDCSPYEGMLRGNYIGMHSTVMFRRAILTEVGGFDTLLRSCEDYELYMRITRRFPVARHDRLVAEYRRHDGALSMQPGRMLHTALDVLSSQRQHIRGDRRLIRACQAGIRGMRRDLLRPLLTGIVAAVKAGNWARAGRLTLQLPTYLPPVLRSTWLDLDLAVERLAAGRGRARG